jgi:hypothetical protein
VLKHGNYLSPLLLFQSLEEIWIIDKNTPYADPEAGLSSGNVQGYQSGAYPSIREIGASLKLQF